MASTRIQISGGSEGFVVSPDSAPFNSGDTVTFVSAAGTADAVICFSDSAADIVEPDASDPVPIAAGATVTFNVTGQSVPGCGVTVVTPDHAGSPDFPGVPAGVLRILITRGRPVPTDPNQGT